MAYRVLEAHWSGLFTATISMSWAFLCITSVFKLGNYFLIKLANTNLKFQVYTSFRVLAVLVRSSQN